MMKFLFLLVFAIMFIFSVFYYKTNYNLEKAEFKIVKKENDFEVREYDEIIFAQTQKTSTRKEAMYMGFRSLFDFIKKNKIPMTVPVFQQQSPEDFFEINEKSIQDPQKTWLIRFVMPKNFENFNITENFQSSEVSIFKQKKKKFLVLEFSGNATNQKILHKIHEIKDFMEKNSLKPKNGNEIIIAFYNSPWTLPFLKKNEILIEIE